MKKSKNEARKLEFSHGSNNLATHVDAFFPKNLSQVETWKVFTMFICKYSA